MSTIASLIKQARDAEKKANEEASHEMPPSKDESAEQDTKSEMTHFTKRRLQTKALLSALKLGAIGAIGGGLTTHHLDGGLNGIGGAIIGGLGGAGIGYGAGQLGGRARMFLGLDPLIDTQAVTSVHK